MSYTPAERTIIHHCVDSGGFVVTLRVTATFDAQAYRELVKAIREYRDAIIGSATMDRRVAGSLNGLLEQLGDLCGMLSRDPEHRPPRLDPKVICDAHYECWMLVQEVFWK